jgi:ribose/xylose/arabinose/galactoside ABC-type transport system permease subunit
MKDLRALVPYAAFVLIFAFFTVAAFNRFDTLNNFSTIVQQATVLAIVGFGMQFVITMGSIDLSVGSTLGLAGLIGASASASSAPAGILVAVGVGALIGLFNGLAFTFLKVSSFMVSLGTLLIARGLTIVYSHSNPVAVSDSLMFLKLFPNIVYVALITFVLCYIAYNYTTFGRYCIAIGGDERVSSLSGVPLNLIKISVSLSPACSPALAAS